MSAVAQPAPILARPAPRRPRRWLPLPDAAEARGIRVGTDCLVRGGVPWFPVTGEVHYSRVPRARWGETLRTMRAGGITVVATYVFWIHHQPERGVAPRFDDGLDVAAFVREAAAAGMGVVLRIGPWCHGEVRGGGLPDWVVAAHPAARSDDPGYLADVAAWWAALGAQLAPWCGPGGPVVGIQLENELLDQPGHLVTLKRLAREVGLVAPLWTATAWMGADLPAGEVFGLWGGYADGFWVDTHDGWLPGFRDQFRFTDAWDDPALGADVAGRRPGGQGSAASAFPPATCELGGGMASAYHRRVRVSGLDVATLAHVKLGSGSVWQGYYMYAGGRNPGADLQESQATGYPNDLPEYDYDFDAPLGALLQLRESFHRLRAQHSFLAAFGDRLAPMPATLGGEDDRVRWALRSDGHAGFLFWSTHRPYEPLPDADGVQFDVALDGGAVRVPYSPVRIPSGRIGAWPVRLDVGGVTLSWATADVLTLLDGEVATLVLAAVDGVGVHVAFPGDHVVEGAEACDGLQILTDVPPSREPFTVTAPGGRLRVLVLGADDALRAWTPRVSGRRRLVLSDATILPGDDGLEAVTTGPAEALVLPALDADGAGFSRHVLTHEAPEYPVHIERLRPPSEPRRGPVVVPDRAPAPTQEEFDRAAARFRVTIDGPAVPGARELLRLDVLADTGRAVVPGRTSDVFCHGAPWDIDVSSATPTNLRVVEVALYPLTVDTPARLTEPAASAVASLRAPTAEILDARVITHRVQPLA